MDTFHGPRPGPKFSWPDKIFIFGAHFDQSLCRLNSTFPLLSPPPSLAIILYGSTPMSAKPPINYGSIPTANSSSASVSDPFVSRFARQTRTLSHTLRPWRELFSLSLPIGYQDAMSRVRRNLRYYRFNYALIVLFVVFLSLLWHPISVIVFLVVFLLWLFLYFSREDPITIFGREIVDRLVLLGLSILTVLALVFTHVGLNMLVSLVVGVFLVGLLAAFRSCDDQFLDVEEVTDGGALAGEGLVSFGGGVRPMRSYGRAI